MIELRILILGNLANDGYSIAKPLWKMNIDVDLAVNSSEVEMYLPEWEDGDISTNIDPYNTHRDDIKNTANKTEIITIRMMVDIFVFM